MEDASRLHQGLARVSEGPVKDPSSSPAAPGPSVSTRLHCSASPKALAEPADGPLTPESPPLGTMRKRAASIKEEEEETESRKENTAHVNVSSSEGLSHVCLCQPDPKIPRPRNAFILYRQHHQTNIAARCPGLSNPDISKILGEQWKREPSSVKNEWKILAEEEKIRHQQQYPEYRYQPRRGRRDSGTDSSLASTSEASVRYRCGKCGGRSIIPPSTPVTVAQQSSSLPLPTPTTSRFVPMMNSLNINSPVLRQGRVGPPKVGPLQMPAIRTGQEEDRFTPLSPDTKRRRFNTGPYPIVPSRPGIETPHPFTQRSNYERGSLPRPDQLFRAPLSSPLPMGPPPPSFMMANRMTDASLTLPPLHTTGDQSRKLEDVVLNMPYLGKIKILGRIAPPISYPGHIGTKSAMRGAIVAVEGSNIKAAVDVTSRLEKFLSKSGEYYAKVAQAPTVPGPETREVSLPSYLELIGEWHSKSKEMIEFVTAVPHVEGSSSSKEQTGTSNRPVPIVPVLLIPNFQLHASDTWASRIPITDTYTPTDHWQWMATMWRGIVGPDLTIYIKDVDAEELGREKMVEVREDIRCLTVRKDRGSTTVDEKALRRVGFEVGEWVRAISADAVVGR